MADDPPHTSEKNISADRQEHGARLNGSGSGRTTQRLFFVFPQIVHIIVHIEVVVPTSTAHEYALDSEQKGLM
jgi:hypothetical protein